ncbi:hypothetical protein A4F89_10035 [Polynucleobacter asymbioticus]|jgi:hypothetical protein|uniref:TnsA endonuclease N-terminal domain-containing protein n=2 Tax=Polynucleobacter asymbioticus TaxID=576611 RepID=A0AAC9ISJ9_9BURK|nr:hypothetical protein A4F89_10035 [Polynucleobacter asymbioticus]APC01954.1 hypothetical protein AOC25_10170 [Polynucleobacter asymbioticus]
MYLSKISEKIMKKAKKRHITGHSKPKAGKPGPARDLIKVSPWRGTGAFSIPGITPYPAQWESYLERYAILTLALCDDVQSIETQPYIEVYEDSDRKAHEYTPDFLVTLSNNKELTIEVKSLKYLVIGELDKYIDIGKHFATQGKAYRFFVDTQIEEVPRFKTAKLLFRYITSDISISALEKIESVLTKGEMSISKLMDLADVQLVDVYTLISKRKLCIDWDMPLNDQANISLPNQPYKGLSIEKILTSTKHGDLLAELALGNRPKDKRLLSSAKAGRRYYREPDPFRVICGFSGTTPLDGFTQPARLNRKSWDRADEAIGRNARSKKIDAKDIPDKEAPSKRLSDEETP